MDTKTKRTIIFVIGVAVIVGVIGTLTYAFFYSPGKSTPEQATISTGTARVIFSDNDTGITGQLAFGESLTKIFTIENTGTVDAKVKMYWKDLVNTYLPESLTFTLSQAETINGTYTEIVSKTRVPQSTNVSKKTLVNSLTIPVGATYYYKLVITLNYLSDANQDADISAKFSSSFDLKDINNVNIAEKIISTSQGVRTAFDEAAETDEGIYEMEDDYGTSYYYRGAVENNYLKYGVNKDGQEMWWRIIRINGDGSVRLIYDGTQGYANGVSSTQRFTHTNQVYSDLYNDAKYIGWMYGPANETEGTTTPSTSKEQAQSNVVDSDIKKVVDGWYKENIVDTGYSTNVSDEIFCNDRSTSNLGYGNNNTTYGVYNRYRNSSGKYIENAVPNLKCLQQNDAFTVNDTKKGNGALTYPVGLITGDEVVISGGRTLATSDNNRKYYLYKGDSNWYWTMSPYSKNMMNDVSSVGILGYVILNNAGGRIAPVINLSAEYASTMVGTGTINDPYRAS